MLFALCKIKHGGRIHGFPMLLTDLIACLEKLRARKHNKSVKTWHEASTSGYCSRELKRNSQVAYWLWPRFGTSHCKFLLIYLIPIEKKVVVFW